MHDLFTTEDFFFPCSIKCQIFSEKLVAVGKVSACLGSREALLYTPF